jgi:hypothetical protein
MVLVAEAEALAVGRGSDKDVFSVLTIFKR